MTRSEYATLQKEWESIEFGEGLDFTRQNEIERLMDASDWALHPDSGAVISNAELEDLATCPHGFLVGCPTCG